MTAEDLARTIINAKLSNEELNQLSEAIKFSRAQLGKQTRRALTLGTQVKFHNAKTGKTLEGTVGKIAIKFITVNCGGSGSWRVPASMLTAA